jgi:hypothetical protein
MNSTSYETHPYAVSFKPLPFHLSMSKYSPQRPAFKYSQSMSFPWCQTLRFTPTQNYRQIIVFEYFNSYVFREQTRRKDNSDTKTLNALEVNVDINWIYGVNCLIWYYLTPHLAYRSCIRREPTHIHSIFIFNTTWSSYNCNFLTQVYLFKKYCKRSAMKQANCTAREHVGWIFLRNMKNAI